jgi:hypothetical protein
VPPPVALARGDGIGGPAPGVEASAEDWNRVPCGSRTRCSALRATPAVQASRGSCASGGPPRLECGARRHPGSRSYTR